MFKVQEGDKVRAILKLRYAEKEMSGVVTEIEEHGFWITEDEQTEEFIAFDEIEELLFCE